MNWFRKFVSRFRRTMTVIFRRAEYMPSGTLYDSDVVGAIAHAIATNVAKLSPQVIRTDASGMTVRTDRLARLLTLRPCPEASTFDWLYKMADTLVRTSNAFSVIFYNDDFSEITRIQPVTVRNHQIFEDGNGNLFLRFVWDFDGQEYTVPYQFVIHLKSRYNKKRFLGTAPDAELKNATDLLEITCDGIRRVIQNSASLRGYLKYNNFMDEDELREKVKEFQSAYLEAENEGGLAGLDSSMEFNEIQQQPRQIPAAQVAFFRENIYRYYGVNEKILNSDYTETEWNSFYEAVIEPIAIQLSLECTFKLLSERQRGFGNKIIFSSNRLQYATLQTRSAIGQAMFDRGTITINEYRELMYLPPIEGGDIRQVSLNYVKADDQSKYQTGEDGGTGNKDPTGSGEAKNSTSGYIRMRLKEGGTK